MSDGTEEKRDAVSLEDEASEIYHEGYECFHKLMFISPIGVKVYVDMDEEYEEFDPERGIACYKKAVEMGQPDAMLELGNCYHDGFYVEQDFKQAFMLYLQASAQGNINARINLAWAYADGEGVEPNMNEAVRILTMEAERGSVVAQCELGRIYAKHRGSMEDVNLALSWLEKAAENERTEAYELLGEYYCGMYMGDYAQIDYAKSDEYLEKALERGSSYALFAMGRNIIEGWSRSRDYDRAVELLEKSWAGNDPDAYYCLGLLYNDPEKGKYDPEKAMNYMQQAAEAGSELARDELETWENHTNGGEAMDNEQKLLQAKEQLITVDYKEGFNTIKEMAEEGYAPAQYQLGMVYYEGKILPMNREIAYQWLDRAAAGGNADAQYQIGLIYYGGDGNETRPLNENLAVQYFESAAAQGHGMAQYSAGNILVSGGKNGTRGFEWLQKAVENGVEEAVFLLGYCYMEGLGTKKDIHKAVEYIKQAADMENNDSCRVAQGVIGNWYLYGTNVPKDMDLAVKYLQKAVDNGNDGAKEDLMLALKKKNKKGFFGLF